LITKETDLAHRPAHRDTAQNDTSESFGDDIDVVPSRDKSAETRPDFRVMTQGVEIVAR
jgi:hypothetical protein